MIKKSVSFKLNKNYLYIYYIKKFLFLQKKIKIKFFKRNFCTAILQSMILGNFSIKRRHIGIKIYEKQPKLVLTDAELPVHVSGQFGNSFPIIIGRYAANTAEHSVGVVDFAVGITA